jgi:hypothetical protein
VEAAVLTEVPVTMVVSVLLSNEYPIEATDWDEQVEALAEIVNGDETAAPFPGLPTKTVANAGAAVRPQRRAKEKAKAFFIE